MSKKSNEKQIKLKRAKKAVEQATPYNSTLSLLTTFERNMPLAAVIGLSVAEILMNIREGTAPKDNTFSQFVAEVCNSRQHALHDLYPEQMPPKPFPISSLIIATMQILDNAELVTGIRAQLVPRLENEKITIDIKTDPKNISLLDKGNEYIQKANSICNLFTSLDTYGPRFAELAYQEVVYILEKQPKDEAKES
ncbi:MAG: hypothetical protein ACI4UM_08070 [Succinivibrio sp.]